MNTQSICFNTKQISIYKHAEYKHTAKLVSCTLLEALANFKGPQTTNFKHSLFARLHLIEIGRSLYHVYTLYCLHSNN